jgi:ferric-dicitrate binding protein FerR (iron transport regulator)
MDDLAKKWRQLAERCYRLSEQAVDADSSAALKRWGDDMMAHADALESSDKSDKAETNDG